MFVQELIEHSGDGLLCVDDCCEVERNSDVDVSGGGRVMADIFKEQFGFGKIKILRIQEFRVRVQNSRPWGHFEEAVDEDDK